MPMNMVLAAHASTTLPPSTCASILRCPSILVIGSIAILAIMPPPYKQISSVFIISPYPSFKLRIERLGQLCCLTLRGEPQSHQKISHLINHHIQSNARLSKFPFIKTEVTVVIIFQPIVICPKVFRSSHWHSTTLAKRHFGLSNFHYSASSILSYPVTPSLY